MNGQRFGALQGEALEMSTRTHYGGQQSRSRAARAVSCLLAIFLIIFLYLNPPRCLYLNVPYHQF